jgi:hypothetical protein
MSVRGYLLAVDWDNSGDPAVTGDDVTSDVLDDPNLMVEWGRDTTQAGSQPVAASFEFGLDNGDRRYSTNNSGSDLYGKILPGRRVQLQQLDSPYVKLFDGVIDALSTNQKSTPPRFDATCLDAWGRPAAEKLSTAVYQGIRTGDAIHLVLDAVGWTGERRIDPGVTIMPFWWEEDTDAATAIERIVDSEGPPSIAYVQGGVFVFEDRHHRILNTASTTTNGLYTHIIPAGTGPGGDFKILKDSWSYDDGLSRIVNAVTFNVEELQPAERVVVWSTTYRYTVPNGTSRDITVQADSAFINAVTPQAGTDYTVLSGTATVSVSRTSGQSATITITASSDAVVDGMTLRANPLVVRRTVKVAASDTASISQYKRQNWPRSVPWANQYDADAIAKRIVSTYANNRPVVTFEIFNLDATYLEQIRERRISDRITVRNDQEGINADFIIEKIKHTVRAKFQIHYMELTCEVPPATQPTNVFTFDVAGKGFNDGLFGLDGIDNPANLFMFDVAGHGFNDGVFGT